MGLQEGTSGGVGGLPFTITPPTQNDDLDHTPFEVAAVIVRGAQYVDALRVIYRNPQTDEIAISQQVGGNGGQEYILTLAPGEFLIAIAGQAGVYVDSIEIITNQQRLLVGGSGGALSYEYTTSSNLATPEEIIGFWGRGAIFIDAIGVIKRPRRF